MEAYAATTRLPIARPVHHREPPTPRMHPSLIDAEAADAAQSEVIELKRSQASLSLAWQDVRARKLQAQPKPSRTSYCSEGGGAAEGFDARENGSVVVKAGPCTPSEVLGWCCTHLALLSELLRVNEHHENLAFERMDVFSTPVGLNPSLPLPTSHRPHTATFTHRQRQPPSRPLSPQGPHASISLS